MNEAIKGIKNVLLATAVEAQTRGGGDERAVVIVMNALSDALVEYCVRATGPEEKDAQARYDELAMPVAKAIQDFLAKYTGSCVIVERKPKDEDGVQPG